MKTENSRKIFEKAKKSIPGGVNSPVRAFQSVNKDYPIFIESAKGSRLYDEDGNEPLTHAWPPLPHAAPNSKPNWPPRSRPPPLLTQAANSKPLKMR